MSHDTPCRVDARGLFRQPRCASRVWLASLLVILALGGMFGATSAFASSWVFIKGGNVWLSNPDGSGQYQVTLDGTVSDPYRSPSQADDGTIVALRSDSPDGSGLAELYRMSQNGQLLNPPFATESPLGDAFDARVSPDGSKVAYWFVALGLYTQRVLAFTYADHLGTPPGAQWIYDDNMPSWLNNNSIVTVQGTTAQTFDLSTGLADWFSECDYLGPNCFANQRNLEWPVVSRDGTRIAVVRQGDQSLTPPTDDILGLLSVNGAPPAKPTYPCAVTGPAGGVFSTPSWSPDGGSLVWAEADGIHSGQISGLDPNQCSTEFQGGGLIIAGGSEPNWGPASVSPAPRGGGGGTGGGGGGGGTGGGTGPGAGGATKPDMFAGTTIRRQTDIVRSGFARVTELCPAGTAGGYCAGTLALASAQRVAVQTAARNRRTHPAARIVALGHTSFSIPAGQHRSVAVRISGQGLRLLGTHTTLAALATATAHDGLGTTTTSNGRITLKRAARTHRGAR